MKANNVSLERDNFRLGLIENISYEGLFDFPKIEASKVKVSKYAVVPFNIAKTVVNRKEYFVHFYIDDYQFERVWNKPEKYLEFLRQFKGVIAPDFSIYRDMPKAQQIWNCYRSRALAGYWQANGIKVVPNASWADESSFAWCFDGLPKNSTIAVSSLGCMKSKQTKLYFCRGFDEMVKRLSPVNILFYGIIPESLNRYNCIEQIATHIEINFKNYSKEDLTLWEDEEVVT